MARKKQSQSTDRLINSINQILESRCSLSERDKNLAEAIAKLQMLKKKKGKTNKEILEAGVEILELIAEYFKS
jgi:F0F1-type ATP synthase beta subunit